MPECRNCGAFVTKDYLRVGVPDAELDAAGRPAACPFCPDRVREGGTVRPARSERHHRSGAYETDAEGRFMSTEGSG